MNWKFKVRPGLMHDGRPLTLWARVKIWVWLRRCEWCIRKEMELYDDFPQS